MLKREWKIILLSVGSILGVLSVIALIMHWFSFEIVYDPRVITSWDAVSGVADWISILVSIAAVVASIIAIVYAIRVPKEIADRQDKIALFDKRCEAYSDHRKLYAIAMMIEDSEIDHEYIKETVKKFFNIKSLNEDEISLFVYNQAIKNNRLAFLFPQITFPKENAEDPNDERLLNDVIASYFGTLLKEEKEVPEFSQRFVKTIKQFDCDNLKLFTDNLEIS